jgi:hemoglobin
MAEQSLYERPGGVNAIAMVVDRFSDTIIENPKLNVNPALKEWNKKGELPSLKFMRTLWACEATGGPFKYTGKPLDEAHAHLHLTSEEFDEVGARSQRRSTTSASHHARRTSFSLRSSPRNKTW